MPLCDFPGCTDYAKRPGKYDYCEAHLTKDQRKKATALVKRQEAEKREAEQQLERTRIAAEKQRKRDERAKAKDEAITRHKGEWNRLVNRVVDQVLVLRLSDPDANAGENEVGTTRGGTNNPVELTLTGETHGITKADVLRQMAGFDSSDSGLFKFRRKGVLVHCC